MTINRTIYLPRLIDAIAIEAVMILHGFGINNAQTTAIQINVNVPV